MRTHTNKKNYQVTRKANERQVKNDCGAYVYKTSIWTSLNRFLVLGIEGNSYYVSDVKKFDRSNKVLLKCLKENGVRTVNEIVRVSDEGLAVKNDPAIFALAKASMSTDLKTRKAAFAALPKVCRIGTHLYMFEAFRKDLEGGWGRTHKESIAKWFTDKDPRKLAYQVAKYKQREGWSARDLLRKSHPVAENPVHDAIFKWVVSEGKEVKEGLPEFLHACNEVKNAPLKRALEIIREYRLPREVLPTELLNDKDVWSVMLESMPITATIRNLGKMSSIGILGPNSAGQKLVCERITNTENLRRGRVHPMNILIAQRTYMRGEGVRGSLSWKISPTIVSALEDAFYESFKTVEPTGKRYMLGLDVSPSMGSTWGRSELQQLGLDAKTIAAAMAMVTLRTEKYNSFIMGYCDKLVDLEINKNMSLDQVKKKLERHNWGSTDCSKPMLWAAKNKVPVDVFVTYTDNDTNTGRHPMATLEEYREKMDIPAKMIVCATEPHRFSVADPDDAGCLDICGFDSSTPRIISQFSMEEINAKQRRHGA